MRFYLENNYLTCLPEKQSETFGFDSTLNKIQLTNNTLYFNYTPTKIPHPDILALICLVVFFPFIKKSHNIIFPLKVSNNIVKALDKLNLSTNTNIDSNLKPYIGGSGVALSWGGGLDSWAVYKLQSELYTVLVHEIQEESPLPPNIYLKHKHQNFA